MNHDTTYPSCSLDARRQARAALSNIYLPEQARVREIIRENPLVNTYHLDLVDELSNCRFSFQPGQFMMISMPHRGEAPISFSSSPDWERGFGLTIRRAGRLTAAVHQLRPGDLIGVRGPYGTPFPMDRIRGKNVLVIGGGIGMAPLRPVIEDLLSAAQGQLTILYGARTPDDFCFHDDFDRWQQAGANLKLTVDRAEDDWSGPVGLVTALLDDCPVRAGDLALVCGPEVMIRAVILCLLERGLAAEDIITTMERQMKCGVGICGHCHRENHLVCLDGPVFTADQIPELYR